MAMLKNIFGSGTTLDYDRDTRLLQEQQDYAQQKAMQLHAMQAAQQQAGMQRGSQLGAMRPGIQEQYNQLYNQMQDAASLNNINPLKAPIITDPNTEPSMQVALIDAHTLWAARWGWDWVPMEKLQDEPGELRWMRLADRMYAARMTEFDKRRSYYKLIPVGSLWKS